MLPRVLSSHLPSSTSPFPASLLTSFTALPLAPHGQESDARLRAAEEEISRTKSQASKLPGLAKLLKTLM